MNRTLPDPGSAPILTHFTRASGRASALDNLLAILAAGVIRAASRMVGGRRGVVCLFDAPLPELGALLARRNRRRYEPFGVAIDRRFAFQAGARPVIYLPPGEARALLPASELWRTVSFDLRRAPAVDWTFEREWRMAGDLVVPPEAVAIVANWQDVDAVFDHFDGQPPCAGVLPLRGLSPSL